MKTIAFLLLTIYFASFGVECRRRKEKDDGKIIGGNYLSIRNVPYQVSIQTRWGFHFCGGSLINDNWVITAAHCIDGVDVRQTQIRAGSSRYAEGGQEIPAKTLIIHSEYNNETSDNDIALIELQDPIEETDSVKPIDLPDGKAPVKTELTVSGWGDTYESSKLGSDYLQYVEVPVLSKLLCIRLYRDFVITTNMFCAGYIRGGRDSCQGDSGGPAVADGKLYGIVSWGNGCGRQNRPGVYVEVANYLDWIRDQIGGRTRKSRGLEYYNKPHPK